MILEDRTILVKQALRNFLEYCLSLSPRKFLSFPKESTEEGHLIHRLKHTPVVYIGGKSYRVHMEMRYYVEEITEPGDID